MIKSRRQNDKQRFKIDMVLVVRQLKRINKRIVKLDIRCLDLNKQAM